MWCIDKSRLCCGQMRGWKQSCSWNSKDMYFSEADTKEFLQQVQIMSHLNQLLYQHFKHEEDIPGPIFQVTSKMHMLHHVAEYASCINPRLSWCYSSEDFMGVSRKIAQNCCRGTPSVQTGGKALQHWRFAYSKQSNSAREFLRKGQVPGLLGFCGKTSKYTLWGTRSCFRIAAIQISGLLVKITVSYRITS